MMQCLKGVQRGCGSDLQSLLPLRNASGSPSIMHQIAAIIPGAYLALLGASGRALLRAFIIVPSLET